MVDKDIKNLSNAEIRVQMKTLEHEYQAHQNKLQEIINHLEKLNKKYLTLNEILNKRSKGVF
mgnify:CR=1 FL=1